jgi:hypothetical protein
LFDSGLALKLCPGMGNTLFGSVGQVMSRSLRLSNAKLRRATRWSPNFPSVRGLAGDAQGYGLRRHSAAGPLARTIFLRRVILNRQPFGTLRCAEGCDALPDEAAAEGRTEMAMRVLVALFFTFQWLGSFAGARDEELRQWAERAVLQGDDRSWIGISGDIDWQRFERQVLPEPQHRQR